MTDDNIKPMKPGQVFAEPTPCWHQFIRISDVDKTPKYDPNTTAMPPRPVPGANAGCIICGEVRSVFANGKVTIDIPAGKAV